MIKNCSFPPTNIPTMEKHVIQSSVTHLGVNKQKPMKRTGIRKHKNKKHTKKDLIFNKVVSYLISDSYLYNPLVCPQPTFDIPPPKQIFTPPENQEDVALPIKGSKNKTLMEKVVDFLQADCFLYSPLVGDGENVGFKSQLVNSTSETQVGHEQHMTQERRDVSGSLRARPVVKKTVSYRESLKHMIYQNQRPKSSQGA
ncbi:uncharacterized protein [Rutidosis leptorrhynchoides]|uniref:uncharacterized protein n=1 Tax=Rutidosis leptorrhynchoides TaxID=125765 RepID=UPI003A9A501A